ncbi:MAG TPA: AMP-binding protein [Acidimicrobiia bacterium]
MPLVSYAQRLLDHAHAAPDRIAVTDPYRSVTRGELDALATRTAHAFADLGVVEGDLVTIALPNCIEFVAAMIACWKLGAVPQPVSFMAPAIEVQAIVKLADSKVIVGAEPGSHGARVCLGQGWVPPTDDVTPLPDAVSKPFKAMTSGGSTGRPKLILAGGGGLIDPDLPPLLMIDPNGCMMVPGPMYHNGPFMWTMTALLAGASVVLGGRFDAETTLALIDEHHADVLYVVPTMMQRIWRLPEAVRNRYDVSSLRVVWHLAAPCPAWLKEAWIDWLGPEKIVELYAGTEAQASTVIIGTQWLEHRGSVGRPLSGQMKIVGPDGEKLPAGEVGEIFMRPADPKTKTYEYVGAEARTIGDGWESLGDMGWFDADGYLYLADRKADMILVGGANVYPAEVEAALEEHPAVQSAVVIGLPDEDLGHTPHALVYANGDISDDDLRAFLGERLVRYKIPRSFEFVDEPLRDDAGKVRRSALREAR